MRTRVGYAGGIKKNPTYHNLGNHTESLQVDYDPSVISYKKLLDVFRDSHNPHRPSLSRQYMSIIFFHDDEQKRLAVTSMEHEANTTKGKIFTKILPYTKFYLAEDYHQKYRLRFDQQLMTEFDALFSSKEDFVNSTAAARVNGYLAGWGTMEDLMEELPSFGLSKSANERLIKIVKSRKGRKACAQNEGS